MKKITKQSFDNKIESNVHYKYCTFHFKYTHFHQVENSVFEECSFRGHGALRKLKNCQFKNCGFSGKLEINLSETGLDKIPLDKEQLEVMRSRFMESLYF